MKASQFYTVPPEIIRCEKKGSTKNGNQVLKSFCQDHCRYRNGCDIRKRNEGTPAKRAA